MSRRTTETLSIAAILGLGAWLRFVALGTGVPYDLASDEPHVMERAVRILKTGDFNPHFFDYPGFYIYLQAAAAAARFVLGAMEGTWRSLDAVSAADFYVTGRAVTALFGLLTVVVVWRVARRIDPLAGVAAALLMAVYPLHVRESHFVLTDVPMTCFVALTLLATVRAVERGRVRDWALVGMAAGLAIGTKYTSAFALVMPLAALAVAPPGWRTSGKRLIAVGAGATGAFLAVAPYTVLDLPGFLNGFAALAAAHANGPVPDVPPWWTYLRHLEINSGVAGSLALALSLPVAVGAVIVTTAPAQRAVWAASLACVAAGYWIISGQTLVFARYLLPLLPALFVMVGGAGALAFRRVARADSATWRRPALAGAALLAILALEPGLRAFGWVSQRATPTTAGQAYAWIVQNVPPGSRLAIETTMSLPAKWPTRHVRFLNDHSREYYDSISVEYFVVVRQAAAGQASPRPYPELLQGTALVGDFAPGGGVVGPWIQIHQAVRY